MVWVRLADDFTDHPKVVAAGPLAGWLYVCGLTYSNRYLTDGFVPAGQVRRMADVDDAPGLAARLVEVGLWEVVEGGFRIHDYHGYQPSADDVKREREEAARRQAEWRRRRAEDTSNATSNGVTNETTNGERSGAPARPGPGPVNPNPAVENHPPNPPPQADGGLAPTRRRRRRDESVAEVLEPATSADEAVWQSASALARQFMMPPLFEALVKPLVPIGRAEDGGLRLRAPPHVAAEAQRNVSHVVSKYLEEVGDANGSRAAIVG